LPALPPYSLAQPIRKENSDVCIIFRRVRNPGIIFQAAKNIGSIKINGEYFP